MNEITNIHLGRQPFTISVEAYKLLEAYLHAIKRQVGAKGKGVVEEVELRMAELLAERGISGDKVVLPEDIDFLKQQLGEPRDFSEGDDAQAAADEGGQPAAHKRLFRDPEHGMIAGVAAGLGAYLGIDPLIIRLLFVVLTFSGAAGILIYLVLWLLVPAARTGSERLQMHGKAVTVDNIKHVIESADVSGTASRAGQSLGRLIELVAKVMLMVAGVGFVVAGLGLLLAAMTAGSYLAVHGIQLANVAIFPVGSQELLAAMCGAAVLAVVAVATLLAGRAMIYRRWSVPAWAVAALTGVFLLSASVGAAFGFGVAPAVSQRYQSLEHSQWRPQPVFTQVHVQLGDVDLDMQNDASYGVEIRTLGTVDTSSIVTKVVGGEGGQLQIDASHFKGPAHRCIGFCPYGPTNTEVVIHGPLPFRAPDADGMINFDPQIAPPDEQMLMPKPQAPTPPAGSTMPSPKDQPSPAHG